MPTETTNYKLKKPLGNEYISPSGFNDNFDIIDEALSKKAELDEDGKISEKNLPNLGLDIDDNLSDTSENAVKNKVVTAALADKAPAPIMSMTDITAGSTSLENGRSYHVYE